MENNEKKSEQNIDQKSNDSGEEKIVNLFEDTGNFHDEEKLAKSYERIDKK